MGKYMIRLVQETDAAEILRIYEPYIKETAVSFECEIPILEEFRQRIRDISADYPYIVCLLDGKIIGYAYAHRQMERDAYQWNAELSAYIDKAYLRHGIGKTFCSILMEILKLQNIRNVYGGITSPNENSERLVQSLGFHKLGVYHHTGYKCGAWHDVSWFEKNIGNYDLEPEPFLSIQKVGKNAVAEILDHYSDTMNVL